jgi:hypothetical protein
MKLQTWTVYRDIDGITEELGEVATSLTGTKRDAWSKAAHKWLLGKRYSIGWKLIVEKGKIREVEP